MKLADSFFQQPVIGAQKPCHQKFKGVGECVHEDPNYTTYPGYDKIQTSKMENRRNVLITGVSSGLGLALARLYLAKGERVWGVDKQGAPDLPLRFSLCDVSDFSQVAAAAEQMRQDSFLPDVAILNAGINISGPADGFSLEYFKKVLDTNLKGALSWVEIFLPQFRQRGHGHFVAISSLSAYHATPRSAAYCASKTALRLAFESLRTQFQPRGIDFTTAILGFMKTGMTANRKPTPMGATAEEAARKVAQAVARRRRQIHYPLFLTGAALALVHCPKPLYDRAIRWICRSK